MKKKTDCFIDRLYEYDNRSMEEIIFYKYYKYTFLYLYIDKSKRESVLSQLLNVRDIFNKYQDKDIQISNMILTIVCSAVEMPFPKENYHLNLNLDNLADDKWFFKFKSLNKEEVDDINNYIGMIHKLATGDNITNEDRLYIYFHVI